jgi:hypothetical protein
VPPASTSPTASAAGRDADAAGRPARAVREAARPDRPQLPRDGGSGGSPTGAILATAENYRRDPVNRLVRAVLDAHLLGDVYLMTQQSIGGGDEIIITPWRHLKDKGAIGLEMGAHYTDLLRYYLGEIESVFGRGLIAEPARRRRTVPELDLESYRAWFASIPDEVVATGEDSVIAMYRMTSGVSATIAYIPCRIAAGRIHAARPRERRGVSRVRARPALAVPVRDDGTQYELPCTTVDAALVAIELHDFAAVLAAYGRISRAGRCGWARCSTARCRPTRTTSTRHSVSSDGSPPARADRMGSSGVVVPGRGGRRSSVGVPNRPDPGVCRASVQLDRRIRHDR